MHIALRLAVAIIIPACEDNGVAACNEPFDLSRVVRDDEGYLLDPEDWSPGVARSLADEAGIAMTVEHWQIVDLIRQSYGSTQVVPEARKLLRGMKSLLGPERATQRYLYRLFPNGYAQGACKIAGMRKPLKLMLDV